MSEYNLIDFLSCDIPTEEYSKDQIKVLNHYFNNQYTNCIMDRQKGKSYLASDIISYNLYHRAVNFTTGTKILVTVSDVNTTWNYMNYIMYNLRNLFNYDTITRHSEKISVGGSEIFFSNYNHSVDVILGGNFDLWVVDELFYNVDNNDIENMFSIILPVLKNTNGSFLSVSSHPEIRDFNLSDTLDIEYVVKREVRIF